jgi:hypothetical protein
MAEVVASRMAPQPSEIGARSGRRGAVLELLAFAMLLVSLDQYIVVVALPDIGRELGFSDQTLQTVVSAYAIASTGFLLLGGRASDLDRCLRRRCKGTEGTLRVPDGGYQTGTPDSRAQLETGPFRRDRPAWRLAARSGYEETALRA